VISALAFSATFVGIVVYFRKVGKSRTPEVPVALLFSLLLGIGLGFYAIALAFEGSTWDRLVAGFLGGLPILTGSGLLWILSQRKTPVGNIRVSVGDMVPDFQVLDSEGTQFSAQELKGQRTLFKFYRGSWCPYCSAELKMFESVAADAGVQVVALSGDSVEDAASHKHRDGLSHRLLSDSDLNVIKLFGVEHHKALGADSGETKTILGMPMPMKLKFKSMAIPTTLLVDETGTIRWIDQSDDYRIRAGHDRIVKAVSAVFDGDLNG